MRLPSLRLPGCRHGGGRELSARSKRRGGAALPQQQKPRSQPGPGGCKPLARACAGPLRPGTWPSSSSALASGRRSRGPSRAPQTLLHVLTQAEEPRGVERSRKEPHLRGMVCAGQTPGPPDHDFLYLLPTPTQRRAGSTPVVTARGQCQLPSSPPGHRAPALPTTPSSTVTSGQQLLGFSSEGAPAWESFPSHSKLLFRPRAHRLPRATTAEARGHRGCAPAAGARPPQAAARACHRSRPTVPQLAAALGPLSLRPPQPARCSPRPCRLSGARSL